MIDRLTNVVHEYSKKQRKLVSRVIELERGAALTTLPHLPNKYGSLDQIRGGTRSPHARAKKSKQLGNAGNTRQVLISHSSSHSLASVKDLNRKKYHRHQSPDS